MKPRQIRSISNEEIAKRIEEEEEQLDQLRFDHAVKGMLENPALLRQKRRLIARLKTILRERESQHAS